MKPLNIVIEILKEKKLLSEQESFTCKSLITLHSLLEEKLKKVLSEEENNFFNEWKKYIKNGDLDKARELKIPPSILGIKSMLETYTRLLINQPQPSNYTYLM
jgi:hypothetical protein